MSSVRRAAVTGEGIHIIERTELPQLVRASRAGDAQARERLVQSVQEQVYFHCLRIVGDRDDAMDAAQDILIAMIGGLDRLKDPESFPGWLDRITVRTCCRYLKRRRQEQRRNVDLQAYLANEEDDAQREPEKALDTKENRRMVVELVDALPPPQRLCALLYYYDGMSVKDIAAMLQIPENTVKSRLRYARQAIRKGVDQRRDLWALGVSPVPFLRYFLQQEAASGLLGAAAAGLTQSVMAAGGAAAGGLAIGAALKSALDVLISQKALVLAGLALAGAVTGGVIANQTPKPAIEPHVRVEEPIRPEKPEDPAPPVEEQPVQTEVPIQAEVPVQLEAQPLPAEPESAPAHPTVQQTPTVTQEAPEEAPEEAQPEDSGPVLPPEDPVEPPPERPELPPPDPGPPPDPAQDIQIGPGADAPPEKPDTRPVWEPSFDLPSWTQPVDPAPEEPVTGPEEPGLEEPTPEEPVTEEPATEEPVKPGPEVTTIAFEDVYGSVGYGHTYSLSYLWEDALPEGSLTYSSLDPSVAVINEKGEFTTLKPGHTVLSASMDEPARRYDLEITVDAGFQWTYVLPDIVIQTGEYRSYGLEAYMFNNLAGYDIQIDQVRWESSNDKIAGVRQEPGEMTCEIAGVSPGTATVTGLLTFLVDTVDGQTTMQDVCSFTVTVEELAIPIPDITYRRELGYFGISSGYGYVSTFAREWGSELPEGLIYTSSNEKALRINAETGEFYTLAAGDVELIATDPKEPGVCYVLYGRVLDEFQWGYFRRAPVLAVGESGLCWLEEPYFFPYATPISTVWSSSDEDIVTVEASAGWESNTVQGVQPGKATVTCTVTFRVETFEGPVEMTDSVDYPIEVTP